MNRRNTWIFACLLSVGLVALTVLAEPRGNITRPHGIEPLSPKQLDRLEARLSHQLREPGLRILEGADPDVVEGGYIAGYHGRNEPWNDVLQASRLDNPMVSEVCRESVLDRVLDNSPDRTSRLDHLKAQIAIWSQVRQEARHLRLSETLLHLAECHHGCAAYVSGVLSCHISGIRQRDRTIVYFEAGRPRSYEEDSFRFSARDRRRITDLARQAMEEGKSIILFSRASGDAAFDQHNTSGSNALAWRRARVVDRLLTVSGVPRDRIEWKALAWETPRLAASDVADAYGFLDDWQSMPEKESMDRSVVLVAH